METPQDITTTAGPVDRRKIRSFMAGQLDASNTTASMTENLDSELSAGSERISSLGLSSAKEDSSPSRGDVSRHNSAGSSRLSSIRRSIRNSMVQIHSSNSIKGINTSDFTIDKLRFSSLGRLYGRDAEVEALKSILCKESSTDSALKQSQTEGEPKGCEGKMEEDASILTSEASTKKHVGFEDDSAPATPHHLKQLLLISGAPGSGKSVLALEAMDMLREQRGFYLAGKYDQSEPPKPFAAVVTAFQAFCEDLILHKKAQEDNLNTKNQTGYHRWIFHFHHFVERIHATFDTEDIQLLVTIIPSLRRVVAMDYYTSESSSEFEQSDKAFQVVDQELQKEGVTMYAFGNCVTTEDYNTHKVRIQSAFKRFVKLICSFGPLVFVLDDVQWIDQASLELLESMIQDKDTPALTIIATYRDNDMDESHCWQRTVKSLELDADELNLKVHRIQVRDLDVDHICHLLEDLISMSPDETRPLAECIHIKTGGNALYVKEFLLALHRDELLTFEFRLMHWEWNVQEITVNAKSTENVVALLNRKIEELPPMFSRLLPKVACLGSRFSFTMFESVAAGTVTDEEAQEALKLLESLNAAKPSEDSSTSANEEADNPNEVNAGNDQALDLNPGPREEPTGKKRVEFERQGDVDTPRTKTEILLAICEQTGFLTSCAQGWYQWEHDKVQEAAMKSVREEDFPRFEFEVGKQLLRDLPDDNLAEVLFVVTSLLNSSNDPLDDDDELKIQIAELNYRSSVAAFQSSAFESAAEFSQKGIALLPSDKFASHYSLALDLHELAAESLFSIGDHEKAKDYADAVIQLDTDLLDKRRAYKAYILALAGQGLVNEAKELTVEVLEMLGVKFPKHMRQLHIVGGVVQLTSTVKKMTKKIDKLKNCTDEKKIWAIDLLDRLITYSFQSGDPDLLSLTMMKGTNLTAKWGISDKSGPLLANAGLLLVILGHYASAKKYAELALKYANRATEARIRMISYRHVLHYQISVTVCKKAQMQGYVKGMETGDLESAFWSIYGFCDDQMLSGVKLPIVIKDYSMYGKQVSQYNLVMIVRCFKLAWQCCVNLVEGVSGRDILNGEIMKEAEMLDEIQRDASDGQTIYNLMRLKILGCFWFKEFEEVVRICEEWDFQKGSLEKTVPGLGMIATTYFHCALACLSVARKRKEKKKGKHMKMAAYFLSRIRDWSRKGDPNTQHYQTLIEAEFLTFKADNGEAKRMYESSIHTSGRLGITCDQALAHERLAENCSRLGYENDAKYHFERALELFRDWGATARADILSQGLLSVAPAREVLSKHFPGDVSTLSTGGISAITGPTNISANEGTG